MARKTDNTIKRTKSFEEKRTGKEMPELANKTEKLTVRLSEELAKIKVSDFKTVAEYERARREIIKKFDAKRKESTDAINKGTDF